MFHNQQSDQQFYNEDSHNEDSDNKNSNNKNFNNEKISVIINIETTHSKKFIKLMEFCELNDLEIIIGSRGKNCEIHSDNDITTERMIYDMVKSNILTHSNVNSNIMAIIDERIDCLKDGLDFYNKQLNDEANQNDKCIEHYTKKIKILEKELEVYNMRCPPIFCIF